MKTVEEELLTVSVNTVKRADVISITPKIERKYLKMEQDTGSAISVIPIKMYRQLFSHRSLSATNTTLWTYSGQIIKPVGIYEYSILLKLTMYDQVAKPLSYNQNFVPRDYLPLPLGYIHFENLVLVISKQILL